MRESAKAHQILIRYLKRNHLSVEVDWTKDPIHGPIVKNLIRDMQWAIEKERIITINDIIMKIKKKLKKEEASKEKEAKKKEVSEGVKTGKVKGGEKTNTPKEEKKEKKAPKTKGTSYDYPKNPDGSEMNSNEKKKYRSTMRSKARKEAKGNSETVIEKGNLKPKAKLASEDKEAKKAAHREKVKELLVKGAKHKHDEKEGKKKKKSHKEED